VTYVWHIRKTSKTKTGGLNYPMDGKNVSASGYRQIKYTVKDA
jgi:hypothetical protein